MFSRLGFIVSRWWLVVLAFWVSAVVVVRVGAPRWDDVTHDGDFAYLPSEMSSSQGERLLASAFPDTLSKSQIALVTDHTAYAEGVKAFGWMVPGEIKVFSVADLDDAKAWVAS